jgi:hypothetical protein
VDVALISGLGVVAEIHHGLVDLGRFAGRVSNVASTALLPNFFKANVFGPARVRPWGGTQTATLRNKSSAPASDV